MKLILCICYKNIAENINVLSNSWVMICMRKLSRIKVMDIREARFTMQPIV